LILANGSNNLTATGVETLTGGTGADTITLGAAQSSGVFNLGAGVDRLTLSGAAANILSLDASVEQVIGGAAADTLTLTQAVSRRSV